MGPNAKVDPLTLLADAKHICDTLVGIAGLYKSRTHSFFTACEPISACFQSPASNLPSVAHIAPSINFFHPNHTYRFNNNYRGIHLSFRSPT